MAAYEVSPEAFADIQAIWDFIAVDSTKAADRVVDEFFAAFEYLVKWPAAGHSRPDLTSQDVRFWPVGAYLIVYRSRRDALQIVAVLQGSRDVPAIIRTR